VPIWNKIRSIRYALRGLRIAWREESNFRFHAVFTILTLLGAWIVGLSLVEYAIVFFMIGFVVATELFNTALEELCDKFRPEHDPHIGKIKDLSAAAVLTASCTALLVGLVIFVPHVLALVR